MNAKRIYTIDTLPPDTTDWQQVRSRPDDVVEKAAQSDPDAIPPTATQLGQFKRVHPPKEINVKIIRQKLHMTQSAFAAYFGVSERTLQEWEQGRREPDGPARTLLMVICYEPEAVQRALTHEQQGTS